MWFIFRREEKNIDNFLLWQTKTGKVVACQEKWLTAFQMALFFIWVAVPLVINYGYMLIAGMVVLMMVFIIFNIRCSALPVVRPRKW